jgi:hypothetical protein
MLRNYVALILLIGPRVFGDTPAGRDALQPSFSGAVLGYVYNQESRELRALLGIPGAAHFSDPIPLPEHVSAAYVAPGHDWALLQIEDRLAVLRFAGSELTPLTEGVARYVAFSPSGREVAFYLPAERRLVVYTGLPATPTLAGNFAIAGAWEDDVRQLALADRASTIAYSVESGRVWRLRPGDETAVLVYHTDAIGGLSFRPGHDQLFVSDATRTEVVVIEDIDSPSWRTLLDAHRGLETPGSLLALGEWLHIAAGKTLWTVALSGNSVESREVPGTGSLQPLALEGAVLLDAPSGAPAWILSGSNGNRLLNFVPAAVKPEALHE